MTVTRPLIPTPSFSYFICSTPRTGSNLLAEALETSLIAGNPKEYFDINYENFWRERLGFTDDTYFQKIIAHSTSPNGVFASKLFWHQTDNLMHRLKDPHVFGSGIRDTLASYFPGVRYIWLRRRDKVRQAISYIKAEHTNQWWKFDGVEKIGPRDPNHPNGKFDFREIDDFHSNIVHWDNNWRDYFTRRSIQPLELVYEDMTASVDETVLKMLEYVGITVPADFKIRPPRLQKQANTVNDEWVAQYHEHLRKLAR